MKINLYLILFSTFLFSCSNIELKSIHEWKKISTTLINVSDTANITDVHTLLYFAYANALINGWDDSKTTKLLNQSYKIIDTHSYGIEKEWDAFGDGSINPITTNYTITITDHVGLVLLEGYKKNKVPFNKIENLYNVIAKIPKADTISNGICYSYSDSPFDKIGCVHNVNISMAYFFYQLKKIKFKSKDISKKLDSIIFRENNSYISYKKNYLYWDGNKRLTDQNHLAFQAWCMIQLPNKKSNQIGKIIIDSISKNREKSISSLIGHLRILPYNEYNSDSLLFDLKNILQKKDKLYLQTDSYNINNSRVIAQLAVWSSIYYLEKKKRYELKR